MTPFEQEQIECTKMLIELAFLLPRGTNICEHSAGKQLVQYVKAVRATAVWRVAEGQEPKSPLTGDNDAR